MQVLLRTAMLALLLALVACGGAEDRKTVYMNKGKEFFAAGNFEKARLEYQNVLQIDPKDLDARFALAETLEKLENWQGAAGHYLAVLNEDPNHHGALVAMGRLYLLSNADDKARESADKLLAAQADDIDGLILKAAVEAKKGDRAAAATTIDKALAKDALNAEAASLKASLLLVDGKAEEAIQLMQDAIGKHPDEVALRINLARVYATLGRADEAAKTFAEVVEQKPETLAYRNAYARFLIGLKRLDEAEAVLKKAIEDFPGDKGAKLAYVEFLSGARNVKSAIEELKRLIAAEPKETTFQFALGKVHEAVNQLDEASALYQGLVDGKAEGPERLQAMSRLAAVKARQKDLAGARKLVDEVLVENAREPDALTLRGTLLLNDGDAAGAIADFRTVLRDVPTNIGATRLLARAHIANKEPELAKNVLKQGIEANPKIAVLPLELANLLASQNDLDGALAALDAGLAKVPGAPELLEAKFKIFVFRKDYDAALAVTETLKNTQPQAVKGYHFAGLVQQAKGDLEASIGEFESALDRAPEAVEPLSQLVKSLLALKRKDAAIARLEAVIEAQPKHFVAHNLLGEIHLADKGYATARKEFETAIEQNPKWPIPYRNLATVMVVEKDNDGAVAILEKGVEATGGQPLLVTALASFLEQTGKLDSAIAQYEKALADNPGQPLAANNLAMLLIEYRDDEASWKRARELVTPLRNSNEPAFLDTVGWVEYKLGAPAQAVLFLEKAVEGAPDAALMHYHLGMAYLANGNAVGAREHLAKAVDSNIEFRGIEEARKALAGMGDEPAG